MLWTPVATLTDASDSVRWRRQLTQILVRLHVEPHRKERELGPEDQQQRDEDDGSHRDGVPHDPQDDLSDPEPEAEKGHQETEDVEEDERVEMPDHVLLPHAPEEALQEEPRDTRHDLADLDPRSFADAVHRPRGYVAHAGVPDVQMHEHVVGKAV